jgi:hypothetical protein
MVTFYPVESDLRDQSVEREDVKQISVFHPKQTRDDRAQCVTVIVVSRPKVTY